MAWSCDCGETMPGNAIICTRCGAAAVGADPAQVNLALERDRYMEGHLRALALWWRVFGGFGLLATIWMIYQGVTAGSQFGEVRVANPITGSLIVVGGPLIVGCALAFVLGHFLARYANWARITAGVFAAVGLAATAIGLVLGLIAANEQASSGQYYYHHSSPSLFFILMRGLLSLAWSASIVWALFNSRSSTICSERYRRIVAASPSVKPALFRSVFFVIPVFAIAIALGLLALTLVANHQF